MDFSDEKVSEEIFKRGVRVNITDGVRRLSLFDALYLISRKPVAVIMAEVTEFLDEYEDHLLDTSMVNDSLVGVFVPFDMFCEFAKYMPGFREFRLRGIVAFSRAVGGDMEYARSIQNLAFMFMSAPEPMTP